MGILENKNMDKKEKKVLTKLFADEDLDFCPGRCDCVAICGGGFKMKELRKQVHDIVDCHSVDYDDGKKGFLGELSKHGCISGMVTELIYYNDTEKFTTSHREAIMELLADDIDNGMLDADTIAKAIQGGAFDNWLAWYSFERIALEEL
jgi:hypothetical protein